MTKLNHNRPLLRYLDNVRREMAIDARRTDTLSFGSSGRPTVDADSAIFPLSSVETKAVSGLFGSIENYLNVENILIAALGRNASRQAKLSARSVSRDQAERRVKAAAIVLSAQMLLSGLDGRMNLVNLYRHLESELKKNAPFLWEFLNEQAMKEGMQEASKIIDAHTHGSRDA